MEVDATLIQTIVPEIGSAIMNGAWIDGMTIETTSGLAAAEVLIGRGARGAESPHFKISQKKN